MTSPEATPSAPPPIAVELEGVDVPTLTDPHQAAVHNVQWQVAIGERWMVGGLPGSGKSSTMSVAAGLVRPLRGRHRLFGKDIALLSETEQREVRMRVGVVFGGGGRLFPTLTVARNIALPLLYHGARDGSGSTAVAIEERVHAVLASFDLVRYADRLPRDLPRRISQRVALARALALGPEVLILDDPIGGLPESEIPWWREFGRGVVGDAHAPATLIITGPDPDAWKDVAHRFACVNHRSWQVVDSFDALRERLAAEETD